MPRYFFDINICGNSALDREGVVLANDEAARLAVASVLHDVALATLPSGRAQVFVATVRSHERGALFRTTMTLATERVGAAALIA
ncbi:MULTISPECIES: DUF6894 family protein [Methylobacterium]|uniref:DUF6894 family protein n=1 Tax=Methylobacterium TaxID=407 RepID=UPI00104B09AE|nr:MULTISPECIES: hypothetical protein [Methylobacterium]MDR7036293.1 hypothetical protein [Methylobacterium sp. BE186]